MRIHFTFKKDFACLIKNNSLKNRPSTKNYGYTLIETVITLAIAAILLSLAVPSFSAIVDNNRIRSTHNELITALNLARSLSITYGKDAYVCEVIDGQLCNSSRPFNADWSKGWMVFVDTNFNGELDPDDDLRLIKQRINESVNHSVAVVFNQRGRLRFRPDGTARSSGFYICSQQSHKHIYLLYTGRTRSNDDLTERQQEICREKL